MIAQQDELLKKLEETRYAILKEVDITNERNKAKDRKLAEYPLIFVLSQPAAKGAKGYWQRIYAKVYRVKYICPVCGCMPIVEDKKLRDGYKLRIIGPWTHTMLKALHISLIALQIMLLAAGVPNQVAALGKMALEAIDVVDPDMMNGMGMPAPTLDSMTNNSRSRMQHATHQANKSVQHMLDNEVTAENVQKVIDDKAFQNVSVTGDGKVHFAVSEDSVVAAESLFDYFNDLKCKKSGLQRCVGNDGSTAWVCAKGCGLYALQPESTSSASVSAAATHEACRAKFIREGKACLKIIFDYE